MDGTLAALRSADSAPDWMTVPEFAAWLGIPKQTVYRWRTEGKGPRAHRIGRHVRFSRESISEWLDAQQEDR